MNLRRTLLLFSFIFAGSLAIAQPKDRWTIQDDGAIRWNINDNIPHDDHLEMSGQQLSVVLRYGVDAQKRFHLNRSLVFPMLRMHPNKTQNNLKQRFDVNIPALVTVDDQTLLNEEVRDVTFNGIMRVESSFGYIYRRKELKDAVQLTRVLYPSTNAARYCEEYTFKNSSPNQPESRKPTFKYQNIIENNITEHHYYRVKRKSARLSDTNVESPEQNCNKYSCVLCNQLFCIDLIEISVCIPVKRERNRIMSI